MNLFRFLFSKWFLINIAIAIIVVIVSFVVINKLLGNYTHHGQEIEVPDYRGYSSDSIQDILNQTKFRMKIVDSLYDKEIRPGAIILQNPVPGSMVKESRSIYFTINAHNAPNILLPAMVNQSSRQVVATLNVLGIQIKRKIYKNSPFNNLVLDVLYDGKSVAEGAELPINSELTLVIGTNNSLPMVALPDLNMLKPNEARLLLKEKELYLGLMIDCNECFTGEDSAAAVIYRTSPQYMPDKRVRLGSTVDYWITAKQVDSLLFK
jgi:beta-lactam-binding protein with PASTA domain